MLTEFGCKKLSQWVAEGPRFNDGSPKRSIVVYGAGSGYYDVLSMDLGVHPFFARGTVLRCELRYGNVMFVRPSEITGVLMRDTPVSRRPGSTGGPPAEEPAES